MILAVVTVGCLAAYVIGALTGAGVERMRAAARAEELRRRVAALESAELVVMSPHGALVRVAVLDLEQLEAMRGSYRDDRTDELHTVDLRMVKRLPW